jgi:hypothetical protein
MMCNRVAVRAPNHSACVPSRTRRGICPICPSPRKQRLAGAVHWSLLVDALVLAAAGLLTTFPWPVWAQAMGTEAWPVGMVDPEIALWLVPLPICFAAAALWLGRRNGRNSRWLTGITVALCAAAVMLSTRPARRSQGMRWCASWRASRDDYARPATGRAAASPADAISAAFRLSQGDTWGTLSRSVGLLPQQILTEEFANDCACGIDERLPIPREFELLDHRHIREAHVDRAL